MKDFLGGLLRQASQALGTFLAAKGVIEADDVSLVTGAVISVAALAWEICKLRGIKFCQDGEK